MNNVRGDFLSKILLIVLVTAVLISVLHSINNPRPESGPERPSSASRETTGVGLLTATGVADMSNLPYMELVNNGTKIKCYEPASLSFRRRGMGIGYTGTVTVDDPGLLIVRPCRALPLN
ncbi:MAG: hypothetical protein JWN34_4044 [Bryobacterales bacterium]|nr:hypothetical protein [Bryobacterales bacterium]